MTQDQDFLALRRAYDLREPGAEERLTQFHARTGFQFFKPQLRDSKSGHDKSISIEPLSPYKVGGRLSDDRISAHMLRVKIAYGKGGPNYFYGNVDPRGYSLHVSISEVGYDPDGYPRSECFVLTRSGYRHFMKEARAFNAKALAKLEADPAVIARLKERVISEWRRENAVDEAMVKLAEEDEKSADGRGGYFDDEGGAVCKHCSQHSTDPNHLANCSAEKVTS